MAILYSQECTLVYKKLLRTLILYTELPVLDNVKFTKKLPLLNHITKIWMVVVHKEFLRTFTCVL